MKIIIVDDEILSRIGIQTLLEREPEITVVRTFESGEEALAFLKECPVDVLVTDLEMNGGMQGLTLIRETKALYPDIGVLILSCHDNFSYAQEAIGLGADCYLLKHEINSQVLKTELLKICGKKGRNGRSQENGWLNVWQEEPKRGNTRFLIGVLRFYEADGFMEMQKKMVAHLLEERLEKYGAGTLFTPRKGDFFIVFQAEDGLTEEECRSRIKKLALRLKSDIRQILSCEFIMGVSKILETTEEIPIGYQEGEEALGEFSGRPGEFFFEYTEEPGGNPFPGPEYEELTEAFGFIDANLDKRLTLEMLAEYCKMSIPSFCKKFKSQTGRTLVQYLNERRVDEVKKYLREKKYTLGEIAEKTGFINDNYMIRVFKKVTGMTISEYKKKEKKYASGKRTDRKTFDGDRNPDF